MEENLEISNLIIIYKFVLGLSEFLLGIGIIIWGRPAVNLYANFKNQELLEDPHDLLIRLMQSIVPYVIEHRGYVVFVLIILGAVKMIGAVGLKYQKLWGVDLLVGLTIILLPFQLISLLRQPSLPGLAYTAIGILITLYLINFRPRDYIRKLKKRLIR